VLGQLDKEGGAIPLLAFQPNGPAVELHYLAGYEKAQARGGFALQARAASRVKLIKQLRV